MGARQIESRQSFHRIFGQPYWIAVTSKSMLKKDVRQKKVFILARRYALYERLTLRSLHRLVFQSASVWIFPQEKFTSLCFEEALVIT
jgi:hypothetical protein